MQHQFCGGTAAESAIAVRGRAVFFPGFRAPREPRPRCSAGGMPSRNLHPLLSGVVFPHPLPRPRSLFRMIARRFCCVRDVLSGGCHLRSARDIVRLAAHPPPSRLVVERDSKMESRE